MDDATLTRIVQRYGEPARARIEAWLELVQSHRDDSELDKINRVNDFFNAVPYADDSELWGKRDHWATPLEFLSTGAGDCEDYSIAKFVTLLRLGVPSDKLRVTFVTTPRRPHMVLAYYPSADADPLILDNAVTATLPHSQRRELRPVYGFNADSVWIWEEEGQAQRAGSSRQVESWRKLTARMRREI